MEKEIPRIYVACLAAYNNGKLHGEWIDCDQEADEIQEEIDAMIEQSPECDAEEWAIHDYEGFQGLKISEHMSLEKVAELAALLIEHGAAYAAYIDHIGEEYATIEDFQDKYQGEFESEKDFAQQHFSESNEIPESLQNYIDWEKVTTDLFINDFFGDRRNGMTYVFNRN